MIVSAPDLPPPPEVPASGPEWFAPHARLPRREQAVRIVTSAGVDHTAVFDVAFTDDWPAGASWRLPTDQQIPFAEVAAWSPDLDAPPRRKPEPEPEAPPEPTPAPVPSTPPALVEELRVEIERTKDVLRILPENVVDWSPHPAIPTLSTLALRTVRIAARIGWILDLDEVERSFEPDVPPFETVDQIFVSYAANADEVFALLRATTPERLGDSWRLLRNGGLLQEMPRGNALRWYGLTPLIHHRAEISLMLRALGLNPPHLYPGWAFTDASAGTSWTVPA